MVSSSIGYSDDLESAHRKLFLELSFKVSNVLVLNLEIQNYKFVNLCLSVRYFDDFESVHLES